jgi:L-amino acid N-acyltransferase YncA
MILPTIRDAAVTDFTTIAAIYAHHVQTGLGSFEEMPPSADELMRRFQAVRARGLPWVVAELGARLVGYCYASPYHSRSAYRFTVQDSVYIAEDCIGRGIGTALLRHVLDDCTARGYRQMMAVVGDSGNEASLRLHARLGFRTIGQALRVGVKFGRWVDIVHLQRSLGEQTARPPLQDPLGYTPPADQAGP